MKTLEYKVVDVVRELKSFNVDVDVVDPYAKCADSESEYDISLIENPKPNNYHAVIVAVNHDEYSNLCEDDFRKLLVDGEGVLIDVKGIFRNKIKNLDYWSL